MPAPLSTTRAEQPVGVYLGASFASLTLRTDVFARQVKRNASPGADSAEFISDYGMLARPGSGWLPYAPLKLQDQCCEVRISVGATVHTIFQGFVTADVLQPAGTFELLGEVQVPNGQVRHTCRGLDWFLERITPHQSITEDYGQIGELFPFNGHSSPPERNASDSTTADASGESRVFAWGTTARLWNSLDIIQYTLRFATAQTGYTWLLAGCAAALAGVTPQIDPRGKSLRHILAEAIRPQDGYAWRLAVVGTTITVTVFSLTDTPVTDMDGGTAIPANTDLLSLAVSLDTDRDITAPVVTPIAESAYRYLVIVSEPIRVVAQFGPETSPGAADGFQIGWTTAQASAFVAATDKERAEDVHRHVYASWRLPANWTGQDGLGQYIVPEFNQDTGVLSFPAGTGKIVPPAIVFERKVPHAWTGDREADEAAALLLLKDDDGNWVQPERDTGDGKCTVGLHLSDTGPGIFLRTTHPAQLAPPDFAGASDYSQDWNLRDDGFYATLSFYSHTPLAIRTTAPTGTGTKRVYVPGYHLWACPYDVFWSPSQTIPGGTLLRDDRPALKRLAAQLSHWYCRTRNTLQYSAAVAPGPVNIGKIVSAMMSATGVTLIGTPVTSETWTWDDRGSFSYGLATDFADLDIVSLSRRKVENTERETSRRVRRLEERLQSLPLREPAATASSGLRLGVAVSPSVWTLRSLAWELPEWLNWAGGYETPDTLTIPIGTVSGTIYAQLMTTPFVGYLGSADFALGCIRLVSDIAGAAPIVGAAVTYAGSRITDPLTPLLWLPVAKFTGAADGSYTLDYLGACRHSTAPWQAWTPWLTIGFGLIHGVSGGNLYMQATCRQEWRIMRTGTVTEVVIDPFASIGSNSLDMTAAGPSPSGRANLHCVYADTWTGVLTHTAFTSDRVNMIVAEYTHDGLGNVLDLALGGAPLGQIHILA